MQGIGWSPTGKYFLYAVSKTGSLQNRCPDICEGIDIWIVSYDGKFKQLLSSETKLAYKQISWHSTETKFITFCPPQPESDTKEREICIVHIPNGEIEHTGNYGMTALYSPIGESYIYISQNNEGGTEYFIVQGLDTTPEKILTTRLSSYIEEKPDFLWSPDGGYIYSIQRTDSGRDALFKVHPDGKNDKLARLDHNNFMIESISPNGKYVLLCDYSTQIFPPYKCIAFDTMSQKPITLPIAKYYMPYWYPSSEIEVGGLMLNLEDGTKKETPESFSFKENNTIYYFDLYGLFISRLP